MYTSVFGIEGELSSKATIDAYNRTVPKPVVFLKRASSGFLTLDQCSGCVGLALIIQVSMKKILQNPIALAQFSSNYVDWQKQLDDYNTELGGGEEVAVERSKSPSSTYVTLAIIGLLVLFGVLATR
ncbi:13.7 kDa [Spodoptera frugiperda ascovirus 1a]|uniref:13.7 kDa n=1 Tax=Spodoptera frugiperda ascovirus 1a TaxID=113370 RepID=Q9DKL5_SFAVA|nr:13.7 kDa [Spodoptera frugiperda ascovirus 1a]CAC19179.1 hypothetical protein [Spodoptera frugiperda ascovirus 1a]CAL44602.1 13.7 kDa [Spodoptera frugiperda ascovirus 1a]